MAKTSLRYPGRPKRSKLTLAEWLTFVALVNEVARQNGYSVNFVPCEREHTVSRIVRRALQVLI